MEPEDIAIWTEKYRPKDFDEVKGQDEIVKRVEAFVKKKNMPHLLFAGPAGVGKTTLSLVIAKKLFGSQWRENFLELNASDERGIDVIRVKVKDFARTRAIGDVPFKIIYLDECLDYSSEIVTKSSDGVLGFFKIGDFVENMDYNDYLIKSVDDNGEECFVKATQVMKLPHRKVEGFYLLKIHEQEIKVTGNHLVITPGGWKPVRELQEGCFVLCPLTAPSAKTEIFSEKVIYELIGLPQEIKKKERYISISPEKKVIELLSLHPGGLSREEIGKESKIQSSKLSSILSPEGNELYISVYANKIVKKQDGKFLLAEEKNISISKLYHIKRSKSAKNKAFIADELRQRSLYPLSPEKAVCCARILGHLFTDGCLSLKTKQLFFSGKEDDMKEIKKDINCLGFFGLGNIRYSKWKNGECWSFGAYKIALLSLLYSLGAPVGKKTDQYFLIPDWIMEGSADLKKEFLASFFGAEGSAPKFQGRTIKPIVVAQSKRIDLKDNLDEYLGQLQKLLSDFGIASGKSIGKKIKNIRKDMTESVEGKIWVKNSRKNTILFLKTIGYRYCIQKQELASKALQYLLWKESLGKKIYTFKPVPHFDEWNNKLRIGSSAFFYVTEIKKIKDPKFVYCIATRNQKFIANNIIVHNCDALTREAQQALRRTMENYTQTCRFILSCNYSSKIIDPIQSRCTVFRFKPLPKEDIYKIIDKIAKSEGLAIDAKTKEALYELSQGDCRRLENIMQSSAAIKDKITEDVIYSVASAAEPEEINEVLALCAKGDFSSAKNKLLDIMLNHGLSGMDVIKQVQQEIWKLKDVESRKKLEMIKECGEAEFRMVEGSDEFIQLEALLAKFVLINSR